MRPLRFVNDASTPCRAAGVILAVAISIPSLEDAVAGSLEWTGTDSDHMISFDDNEYARGVQVEAIDEFLLHVAWAEDAPSVREVHYGQSGDNGDAWSCEPADRQISFSDGNSVYEEVSMSSWYSQSGTNHVFIAWSEDHIGTREVHYGISNDDGSTFSSESADQLLSDPSTEVDTGVPSVFVDRDDDIHVVWQQVVDGAAEVHYSRSTDSGTTWSGSSGDRVISFPDGNGAITPQIFATDGGRLMVAWRENGDAGSPVIHVGMSDDDGTTWTSETADREISQPVRLMTHLDASTGIGWPNGAFIVHSGSLDTGSPFHYEIYVTYTTDNGATWTGETELIQISHDEDHTRSAHNPDVFATHCGLVLAAWDEEDDDSGTNEQHISIFDGDVWSGALADEIISFPDGENGYRPSIGGVTNPAIPRPDGRGYFTGPDTYVTWTEFAGGATDNYEVHLSRADLCSFETGIDPVEPPESRLRVSASPNPTQGPVRIELSSDEALGQYRVDIFDATGRSVRSLSGLDEVGTAVLDWSAEDNSGRRVAAGMYLLRVESEIGSATVPVVIF